MKVIRIIACILLLSVFSLINVVHAQSVTLIPKWTAQAQFAGYYVAEKMGFYKEEGLDVHVKHPSHSENSFPIKVIQHSRYAINQWWITASADR